MEIYIRGLASGYEPEHVARLFFQPALLAKRWPARGADAVAVLRGKKRFVCGVRMNGLCAVRTAPLAQDTPPEQAEYEICRLLFLLLCEATGRRPAWGMLTGVRPVRLVHDMRRAGKAPEEIESFFRDKYFAGGEKYKLAVRTADNQAPVLALNTPRSYSLYISIPFCPSRCSYCSFVSRTTAESGSLIEPYVQALCRELAEISALARRNRLRLETIYIGGGTPTAVSAAQLRTLMQAVRDNFDVPAVREYTVEAGRPDCTTPEKLAVIKEYGATRISINPQTLSDEVLAAIGRRHTAQDVLDCFAQARRLGHGNINMDLIAGLPLDTPARFAQTLQGVLALAPENITVHTLTLKRAQTSLSSTRRMPMGMWHACWIPARCWGKTVMSRITCTARRARCRIWRTRATPGPAMRGCTTCLLWRRCTPSFRRERAVPPSWWGRTGTSGASSTINIRWNTSSALMWCKRASRELTTFMPNTLIWIPKRLVELGLVNVAARSPEAFIDYCEQDYAARVEHAAACVRESGAHVVMLTGPSASGKTTTAHKLADCIAAHGRRSAVVSLDNFYKDLKDYPRLPDGSVDYESVDALDISAINRCLLELIRTGRTQIPDFDFCGERRRHGVIPVEVGDGVVVIEGIHALNPRLTALLPEGSAFKIYAGMREEYSRDGQRILPTRDVRLARRMVRDHKFRGHSLEKTFSMWPAVCEGEDKNIKVFKPEADLLLDTSFSYEVCCLAPFVTALRGELAPGTPYAAQLESLCSRFALCMPLPEQSIPRTSMLREFIG